MVMPCGECGADLECSGSQVWPGFRQAPIECPGCRVISWVDVDWAIASPSRDVISPIPMESVVVVVNREHPRFLQPGVIADKSHLHLRIEFVDGVLIWMPEHWIRHYSQ